MTSGSAGYVHLEGIDQPIGLIRPEGTRVINYAWRGLGESSVFTNGASGDCSIPFSNCTPVQWPGKTQSGVCFTPNLLASGPSGPYTWFGTLAENGGGSTGMLFRRNRYFDPVSGRFTQQDPIGVAGGMNLYGFADGDPVNFADPFGLNPLGKIIKLGVTGFKTVMRGADEATLVRVVAEGKDVLVGSQQAASRIARAAGGGKRPVGPEAHKLPGGAKGRSHYHPSGREGGHVFYSIASGLTLSHYAKGRGGFVEGAAAVGDFFNPLSIGKDLIDTYDMLKPGEKKTP